MPPFAFIPTDSPFLQARLPSFHRSLEPGGHLAVHRSMRAVSWLRNGHIMRFHVHFLLRRFSFAVVSVPLPPLLLSAPSLDPLFPSSVADPFSLASRLLFVRSTFAFNAKTRCRPCVPGGSRLWSLLFSRRLPFLTVRPHKQNGGLLFLLL